MLELGAHMSIAGGCELALRRAAEFGMASCQLFTKNASQWKAKPIDAAAVERFAEERSRTAIHHLVAHDSYLINLASPDDSLRERSSLAFGEELDRCEQLGIPFLVTHPGAHVGSGAVPAIHRVATEINRLHDARPNGQTITLLETTAGQGTTLGRTFDELAEIIGGIEDRSRVGVCFDTCHAFAAGYDLRDRPGYDAVMSEFDATLGFEQLRVFHLNDSKKGLGSRVDRHAPIGDGELGLDAFAMILNDSRFNGHPGLLETPKGDDGEEDRRNLTTLRSLVAVPPLVS